MLTQCDARCSVFRFSPVKACEREGATMKFRVRNKEGELEFPSFKEVEQFWLMGFIEPDDEILEEGKERWRKANTFPLLVNARRPAQEAWRGTWYLWALIGICGGSGALVALTKGELAIGGVLAVLTSLVTIHVNVRAHRRSKPHPKQ